MEQRRKQRSFYQDKYTIVLLGRKARLKEIMVRRIIDSDELNCVLSECVLGESSSFRVISAPDIFDENNLSPDQHIIDCMALSYPGPHLFILAIDLDNAQEPKIVEQIQTLQTVFGDVCQNLVVTLPDIESFQSFSHLNKQFNILLATANENLATECKGWCVGRKHFIYNYNNYSEGVVKRRRGLLSGLRSSDRPPCKGRAAAVEPLCSQDVPRHQPPAAPPQNYGNSQFFNIILLGLTGTGKSASANTILRGAKSKTTFESMSNSEPVTKKCQYETVEMFGTQLTVVDTPDFFHENIRNSQEQLEECKKYFVSGHYMVLLVLKLNRFTDEEWDILQKLENKLAMNIRENTTLLMTCGEDLKGKLTDFIKMNPNLQKIAEQCCYRCHLFKNKKNVSNQVRKLIKKIPQYEIRFPKIDEKSWPRFQDLSIPKLSLNSFRD